MVFPCFSHYRTCARKCKIVEKSSRIHFKTCSCLSIASASTSEPSKRPPGRLGRPPWRLLGVFWAQLGGTWAPLGLNLEPLGQLLGPTWRLLGPTWGLLGPIGRLLGATWRLLGPTWRLLDPIWRLLALREAICRKKSLQNPCEAFAKTIANILSNLDA